MTTRTSSFRHIAAAALWASLGLTSIAHAAEATEQRVALACTSAATCAAQPAARHPAARPAAHAIVAKKAARTRVPTASTPVDYERDLWRHQSAS